MTTEAPAAAEASSALALVRPIATPAELLAYHGEVMRTVKEALVSGVDYGVIPGTDKGKEPPKPCLLKPGAEKLCIAFGAAPTFEVIEQEIEHDREVRWTKRRKEWRNSFQGDREFRWVAEDGTTLGVYRFVVRCRIMRGGRLLGEAIGTCSTMESKYIDRARDCENTAIKMAQKRALVSAVLHAFGLSSSFAADLEDHADASDATEARRREAPAAPPKAAAAPAGDASKAKAYDGSKEHQEVVQGILKSRGVPEDKWEAVHERMLGRPSSELNKVIAEVVAS